MHCFVIREVRLRHLRIAVCYAFDHPKREMPGAGLQGGHGAPLRQCIYRFNPDDGRNPRPHARDLFSVHLWNAPHVLAPRLELVFR